MCTGHTTSRTPLSSSPFHKRYSNFQDCGALENAKSPKCPSPAKNSMCSAIMLWRVPAPKVAVSGTFDDPAVARAIGAGKDMVDAWIKVRCSSVINRSPKLRADAVDG